MRTLPIMFHLIKKEFPRNILADYRKYGRQNCPILMKLLHTPFITRTIGIVAEQLKKLDKLK